MTTNTTVEPYTYGFARGNDTYVETGCCGGTGGTTYQDDCPAGQFVYGLDIRADTLTRGITVKCASPGMSGTTFTRTAGTTLTARGATSGYTFSPDACPGTQFGSGLQLRSGSLLDAIGLNCADPQVGTR